MIKIGIKCSIVDNSPEIKYNCKYKETTLDQIGLVIGALEYIKSELLKEYATETRLEDNKQ